MKQLTILMFFLLPLFAFAQEGTTLEEYRYLSKGYVYQLEMGLDADKEGYSVQKLFTASNDAKLIAMYQYGQSDARAILLIIQEEDQKPVYICIPNKNSDERVMSLFELDQKKLSHLKVKDQYETAMQEFLFAAISGPVQYEEPVQLSIVPAAVPQSYDNAEILASKGENNFQEKSPVNNTSPANTNTINPAVQKTKTAKQGISGELSHRVIVSAPEAVVASRKKGLVAVKVCVDNSGYVTSAKYTQRGSTTFDRELKKLSVDTAAKYRFSKHDVVEQCGIITFKF